MTAEEARYVDETGSPCLQIELVEILALFQMPFLLSPLINMLPLFKASIKGKVVAGDELRHNVASVILILVPSYMYVVAAAFNGPS